MSYWLSVLLDNIKVTNMGDYVEVTGMRTKLFFKELIRVYGTTRFQNGMMQNVTATSFTISNFFLYDFHEIIKTLKGQVTRYYRQELIDKLLIEIENIPEIRRISQTFPSRLNYVELERFPFTPLPHQSQFFEEYDQKTQKYQLNGYILAAEPGLGKTLMSLMLMAMLDKDVTIVFSPNNALNEVWRNTINSIKGTVPWVYPDKLEDKQYTHYVFSHENTKYAKEVLTGLFAKYIRTAFGIILDECHKFTELSANQTNNIIEICRSSRSEDILFMSGTPFKALGSELLPFLMATDPKFTQNDLIGFRKMFGVSGSVARSILSARIGRTIYVVGKTAVVNNDVTTYVVKVTAPDGMRFTLNSIKIKMKDFIKERYEYYRSEEPNLIKEYRRIIEQFAGTPKAKSEPGMFNEYKRLADLVRATTNLRDVKEEIKFTNHYEKTAIMPTLSPADKVIFKNVKSVYKYLTLKIQGEALGRVLGTERIACNMAIVNNIDNGKIYSAKANMNGDAWALDDIFSMSNTKTVMFTDYVEVLKQMNIVLKMHDYQPELVYGDTNKDLVSILKKVQDDPDVNPVVATYKSLSTAVPLIICDSCVLLNLPFRNYIYEQAVSRIDRLGQKHPVHIYHYQLDTGNLANISTRSNDIMAWSKKMVDELLGIQPADDVSDLDDDLVVSEIQPIPDTKKKLIYQW